MLSYSNETLPMKMLQLLPTHPPSQSPSRKFFM
jgi:hypothetical protein